MESSTIALTITAVSIVLFATEVVPMAITAVLVSLMLAMAGVITYSEAFAGFSSDVTMFVLGMSAIASAMFETGATFHLGKWLIRYFNSTEKGLLMALLLGTAVLSAFVSNTASVLLFMSMITAVKAGSGQRITKKNTYMAISFASVVGGGCTLIGSTPQLIAQSLLVEMALPRLQFFTLALAGIPILGALLAYYYLYGYGAQNRLFAGRVEFDEQPEPAQAFYDQKPHSPRTWLPVVILTICVITIIAGIATPGAIAMMGACICVMAGCISHKKLFSSMDWNTIFVLGGIFGFAAGLEKSGAGMIIANAVIGIIGSQFSPRLFFALIVFAVVMTTNFISNTAAVIIFLPIALNIGTQMQINLLPLATGVIWGSQLAFMTPIGTPPVTISLAAGYRFSDYFRLGAPFSAIAYLTIIIVIPFFMPL